MIYRIEEHATLPALIATWDKDFEFMRDARDYSADIRERLNARQSPIFYIMNISLWTNMPFSDLLEASSIAARGKDANFHNPMNAGTLMVTTDPAVKISANGLKSDAFGNANVLIFSTLEDALAYVSEETQ